MAELDVEGFRRKGTRRRTSSDDCGDGRFAERGLLACLDCKIYFLQRALKREGWCGKSQPCSVCLGSTVAFWVKEQFTYHSKLIQFLITLCGCELEHLDLFKPVRLISPKEFVVITVLTFSRCRNEPFLQSCTPTRQREGLTQLCYIVHIYIHDKIKTPFTWQLYISFPKNRLPSFHSPLTSLISTSTYKFCPSLRILLVSLRDPKCCFTDPRELSKCYRID